MEEWRDIEGYEGYYQVSNEGRIRSLDRTFLREDGSTCTWKGKILSQSKQTNGYLTVQLYKNNITKRFRVHRLVAEAFIPNPNNYTDASHIDENFLNNNASNLEWCEHKTNCRTPQRIKRLQNKGKWVIRLSTNNEILHFYRNCTTASKETGIDFYSIYDCCNNKPHCHTAGGFVWKYAI